MAMLLKGDEDAVRFEHQLLQMRFNSFNFSPSIERKFY